MGTERNVETTPEQSCLGCKFLYTQDSGWSNWTVEETEVRCALRANPNLPADQPWNWTTGGGDNWPATNASRCVNFAAGPSVSLDVEGETHPRDCTDDPETIAAVCAHAEIAP